MRWLFASLFCLAGPVSALDCTVSTPGLLLADCDGTITARLRVLPQDEATPADRQITVTGAYSSGDRFGIEGLAIRDGEIVSRRFQGWDGLLLLDPHIGLRLFNVRSVMLRDRLFDLTNPDQRQSFLSLAQPTRVSVLQSHLLISDGRLDLQDLPDAPHFIRRVLFQDETGDFGVYQTRIAMTLYQAAIEVMTQFQPKMALNLDMGAYDYCVEKQGGTVETCGNLLTAESSLTNLLEFSFQANSP